MFLVFFPPYLHELLYLTSPIKAILSWDKSLGNWEILLSSRVSFHQKTIHVWPLFFMFISKIQSDSITAHNHYFFLHVHFQNTHTAHYQWDHEVPVNSKSVALQWLGRRNIRNFLFVNSQQLLNRYPLPLITIMMENIFKPYKKPCARYCIYRPYIL